MGTPCIFHPSTTPKKDAFLLLFLSSFDAALRILICCRSAVSTLSSWHPRSIQRTNERKSKARRTERRPSTTASNSAAERRQQHSLLSRSSFSSRSLARCVREEENAHSLTSLKAHLPEEELLTHTTHILNQYNSDKSCIFLV